MEDKTLQIASTEAEKQDSSVQLYSQMREEKMKRMYAAMKGIQLTDIAKTTTRTYTTYTKELFRSYIQNPASNAANLRQMSEFLYRVSQPYKRLIKYYSEMFLFYWQCIPLFDFSAEQPDPDSLKSDWYKVLQLLKNLKMEHAFVPVLNSVFLRGVYYGYLYVDGDSVFLHELDPDYCKPAAIEDGCINLAFDFSYFTKYPIQLEYMDKSFKSGYNKYQADRTNNRWQILSGENTICIVFDWNRMAEAIIPPLSGVFEDLIDLIDYKSLIRNREEIQNYKLIVEKMPLFNNKDSREPDDFSIDMDTAKRFHDMLSAVVPDGVGIGISPMEVETVDFKRDSVESDVLANATRSLFDSSGTSQMLFNTDKGGSVGLDASIKTDEAYVIEVIRQIERWVQRYIRYNASAPFEFKFLDITIYSRDKFIERELKLAQYGVPNKIILAAAHGQDPMSMLCANYLETQVLGLQDSWKPLNSSFTSNTTDITDEGGRPTEDIVSESGTKARENDVGTTAAET